MRWLSRAFDVALVLSLLLMGAIWIERWGWQYVIGATLLAIPAAVYAPQAPPPSQQ